MATATRTPEYLTLEEAAELLNLNVTTVRRAAERGELPALRIGNRWRIDRDGLTHAARSTLRRRQRT